MEETTVIQKSLKEKAVTVNMTVRQWGGRKNDKKVSSLVEEQHGAKNAGTYNKWLVPKEATKEINTLVSRIRQFNQVNTLPWGDNGDRLLPATNYLKYQEELNDLTVKFEKAVETFISNYDLHIEEARVNLSDMFDINEYPTKEQLRVKYAIERVFMNVPDNDFRVGLGEEEINKLKTAAELEVENRIREAMQDTWNRVKETLKTVKAKLEDVDAKVFHKTTCESLSELGELLPRLNLMEDPALVEACNDIKAVAIDPEVMRTDTLERAIKARELNDLLNKYKDFF